MIRFILSVILLILAVVGLILDFTVLGFSFSTTEEQPFVSGLIFFIAFGIFWWIGGIILQAMSTPLSPLVLINSPLPPLFSLIFPVDAWPDEIDKFWKQQRWYKKIYFVLNEDQIKPAFERWRKIG